MRHSHREKQIERESVIIRLLSLWVVHQKLNKLSLMCLHKSLSQLANNWSSLKSHSPNYHFSAQTIALPIDFTTSQKLKSVYDFSLLLCALIWSVFIVRLFGVWIVFSLCLYLDGMKKVCDSTEILLAINHKKRCRVSFCAVDSVGGNGSSNSAYDELLAGNHRSAACLVHV